MVFKSKAKPFLNLSGNEIYVQGTLYVQYLNGPLSLSFKDRQLQKLGKFPNFNIALILQMIFKSKAKHFICYLFSLRILHNNQNKAN
jgi:hypothetical protein